MKTTEVVLYILSFACFASGVAGAIYISSPGLRDAIGSTWLTRFIESQVEEVRMRSDAWTWYFDCYFWASIWLMVAIYLRDPPRRRNE